MTPFRFLSPTKKNLNYKRTSKQKPVRQKQKVEKCEKKILRSQKNEWLFSDQENYLFSTLQTCFQWLLFNHTILVKRCTSFLSQWRNYCSSSFRLITRPMWRKMHTLEKKESLFALVLFFRHLFLFQLERFKNTQCFHHFFDSLSLVVVSCNLLNRSILYLTLSVFLFFQYLFTFALIYSASLMVMQKDRTKINWLGGNEKKGRRRSWGTRLQLNLVIATSWPPHLDHFFSFSPFISVAISPHHAKRPQKNNKNGIVKYKNFTAVVHTDATRKVLKM